METQSEVERLAGVYRQYGARGWSKTKWAITNRGNQANRKEWRRKLRQLLEGAGFFPLGSKRILDVGCGTGEILGGFEGWGAQPENLFGVDLLAERIQRAKENFPELAFQESNAEALPFGNGSFDLVLMFTVFSSILDQQMARNVSCEVDRILCSGGAVVWYDFRRNNPFNPNVRGISRKEVRELFPEYDLRLASVTLLPPLARRLGPLTSLLYPCFACLPFLRSHYLGVLIKP